MARMLFLLLLLPWMAQAARVYRCVAADGGISFQQTACSRAGTQIETGEAQAVWEPLRERERKLYLHYRKQDRERLARQRRAARRSAATRDAGATAAACFNRQVALENVSARLRAGYRPAEGDRLRRRRDQLEAYLRRFCR